MENMGAGHEPPWSRWGPNRSEYVGSGFGPAKLRFIFRSAIALGSRRAALALYGRTILDLNIYVSCVFFGYRGGIFARVATRGGKSSDE